MNLTDKLKDASCYFGGKLHYRAESSQRDALAGIKGYCLCDADYCPYVSKINTKYYCNADVKRKVKVYKR